MSGVSKPKGFEQRDAALEFRFDGDESRPVVRGTPIVFNAWSSVLSEMRGLVRFRESISPSAVDRTLKGSAEVLAYWNHNADEVLGNTRSGTLHLRKNADGLGMELYPTPEWMSTPHAAGLKRGDVRHMSFGFSVVDDKWSDMPDEDGVYEREILDMVFSEVSIVGRPAYTQTSVMMSSRGEEQRVLVSDASLERFTRGISLDFAQKLHKTRMARE